MRLASLRFLWTRSGLRAIYLSLSLRLWGLKTPFSSTERLPPSQGHLDGRSGRWLTAHLLGVASGGLPRAESQAVVCQQVQLWRDGSSCWQGPRRVFGI